MPVFKRMKEGILVLTVDGDFTANELRRVALDAFEDESTPQRVPVLLDMSGAAGLSSKAPEEMSATGAIFGDHRDRMKGLAVVAAADVQARFNDGGDFARGVGAPLKPCQSHAEAREWLAGHG